MIEDFVRGHPAEPVPRSRDGLRAAYFGEVPVARLFVAERRGEVVGMGQWAPFYDLFWGKRGGKAEWLYVRPAVRGTGAAAAILAALCADIRRAGGEYVTGGYEPRLAPLYERIAIGWPMRECAIAAEAFQVLADLAGRAPREIVRHRPAVELNRIPARPRP
jgi:GNAT superfamily N-acetyltransferase